MKTLVAMTLLSMSAVSFGKSCFKAVDSVSPELKLPAVVCVESYSLELVVPKLPEQPSYRATVVTDSATVSKEKVNFTRNENSFDVKVQENKFYENEGVCESLSQSYIQYNFRVDSKAKVLKNTLTVTGIELTTNDTCHSSDDVRTVRYQEI